MLVIAHAGEAAQASLLGRPAAPWDVLKGARGAAIKTQRFGNGPDFRGAKALLRARQTKGAVATFRWPAPWAVT